MNSIVRILVPLLVIVVLAVLGIIDLSILPMHDPDFQVTLATVAVYMVWSVFEDKTEANSSRITLYAILLVSALDSFLLNLTAFTNPVFIRWSGVLFLFAGCALRLIALRSKNLQFLRYGRILQGFGIATGLGSIAGVVIAIFPGIPSALKEDSE